MLPSISCGLGVALELPWSIETGRVTDALVQCPKLCPYISRVAETEYQPLSGRDSFSAIRGGKSPNNVQFQQMLKN